jgi:hypothetical protein
MQPVMEQMLVEVELVVVTIPVAAAVVLVRLV